MQGPCFQSYKDFQLSSPNNALSDPSREVDNLALLQSEDAEHEDCSADRMLTLIRGDRDGSVAHNLTMFLHFMVNDVKIIEEHTMTQLINKMYKFTKQFNLIDSVKHVPGSWNDNGLHDKYLEAIAQKGKYSSNDNPDLFIFTKRKDIE